ncbi:MAG: Rpn family recombination-promoting nuclease/putative transposase [Deltaproteobacteria bacterium]
MKTPEHSVHQPHAKLFEAVFSDPVEAVSFFQAYLPDAMTARIDWNTLVLKENSFIDEEFHGSESDILFQAKLKDRGKDIFLYVLFEHQSKPDKWVRFRLLKYMCRIWDASFKEFPKQKKLIPVLPAVFYQGNSRWNYSTQFSDLFHDTLKDVDFVPRFSHVLTDQSGFSNDEIKGALKARIAQLLMKAAFHGKIREIFSTLSALMSELPESGGIRYVRVFIRYIAATQERKTVDEFTEIMKKQSERIGENMITAAQEWFNEGFNEGLSLNKGVIEGQIQVIEKLLKAGVTWDFIYKTTDFDENNFHELKKKLQQQIKPVRNPTGQAQLPPVNGVRRQ